VQILNKDITYSPRQQEESEMKTTTSFRHWLGDRKEKKQCGSKPKVGARHNRQPQGCITHWSAQTMAAVTSESFGTGPRRTGGRDDSRSRKDKKAVKSNWVGIRRIMQ
jgi:hypothetical protein